MLARISAQACDFLAIRDKNKRRRQSLRPNSCQVIRPGFGYIDTAQWRLQAFRCFWIGNANLLIPSLAPDTSGLLKHQEFNRTGGHRPGLGSQHHNKSKQKRAQDLPHEFRGLQYIVVFEYFKINGR